MNKAILLIPVAICTLFVLSCKEPVPEEPAEVPEPTVEPTVEVPVEVPEPEVTEAEINEMKTRAATEAETEITKDNMDQAVVALEREIDMDTE